MNIFYYSVHHVLEDDEVRLLKSLGHNVMVLGVNSRDRALQDFRDSIPFSLQEHELYDAYERYGGNFYSRNTEGEMLPEAFVGLIDVFVVMHDVAFIETHWLRIKHAKVIWRSIGQDVEAFEDRLRPLRDEGLHIIRYSETERDIPNSVGQDAIIRFFKDEYIYSGWNGRFNSILTFASRFAERYPVEADDYRFIIEGVDSVLGGLQNPTFSNWKGLVSSQEQIELYRSSRVYLYASGLNVPYTLNFLEAWITGLPIVVYAPPDRLGPYFEISRLVKHNSDGFVCETRESARHCCRMLMDDQDAATAIGSAGRRSAIKLFSLDKARNAWRTFLDAL